MITGAIVHPGLIAIMKLRRLVACPEIVLGAPCVRRLSGSVSTSFTLHRVPAGARDAQHGRSAFASKEFLRFLRRPGYSEFPLCEIQARKKSLTSAFEMKGGSADRDARQLDLFLDAPPLT